MALGNPKPEPRKRQKARKDRRELQCKRQMHDAVFEREENACRLSGVVELGPCDGPLQLAHYGDWRRSKTRGMDPEQRHVRHGGICLCKRHHDAYDGSLGLRNERMHIDHLTDRVCDGPLRFERGPVVYIEEAA